jgi:dTMP kinase
MVLEGGDGSGKSTQAEMLALALRRRALVDVPGQPKLLMTREPGGTQLGASIRQLLLHQGDLSAITEALLYAADRAEHVAKVIRPALADGQFVISDRFVDSSIAYQTEGRGLPTALVQRINDDATGGLVPDLTVLLDIDVETGAARRAGSGRQADRLEAAGQAFHARVNRRYRQLAAAAATRYAVIDARQDQATVHQQIWTLVEGWMAKCGMVRSGDLLAGYGPPGNLSDIEPGGLS